MVEQLEKFLSKIKGEIKLSGLEIKDGLTKEDCEKLSCMYTRHSGIAKTILKCFEESSSVYKEAAGDLINVELCQKSLSEYYEKNFGQTLIK